jgi:FkbM family methyltransferase
MNESLYKLRYTRYGQMLYNPRDRWIGRSIDLYAEYCEGELDMIRSSVPPGGIALNIGANIGALAIPMAKHFDAVFAWEPQRLIFQMLCANIALNGLTNVYAFNAGVGAARDVVMVPVLNPAVPDVNHGGLSLMGHAHGEPVLVGTIDTMQLDDVALLQADVEGMELQVLQGAQETIRRCRPVMYLEDDRPDNRAELRQFVTDLGYTIIEHSPPLYNPDNYAHNPVNHFDRTCSINILCLPK